MEIFDLKLILTYLIINKITAVANKITFTHEQYLKFQNKNTICIHNFHLLENESWHQQIIAIVLNALPGFPHFESPYSQELIRGYTDL